MDELIEYTKCLEEKVKSEQQLNKMKDGLIASFKDANETAMEQIRLLRQYTDGLNLRINQLTEQLFARYAPIDPPKFDE